MYQEGALSKTVALLGCILMCFLLACTPVDSDQKVEQESSNKLTEVKNNPLENSGEGEDSSPAISEVESPLENAEEADSNLLSTTTEVKQRASDTRQPERESSDINWKGNYAFENDGGKAGKSLLGNQLELEIIPNEVSDLKIFSSSMMTPHAILKVKSEIREWNCDVLLSEYVRGNGWEELEVGTKLFSLNREGKFLTTIWEAWKPLYGELPNKGEYFKKVEE